MPTEAFTIATRPEVHTLTMRRKTPMAGLQPFLAECLPAAYAQAEAAGALGDGAPFARYHSMAGGEADVEAGIPVTRTVAGEPPVQASSLPGGEVASAIHVGSYETIGESFEALMAWVGAQGRQPTSVAWESYLTDPEEDPDPATWRTEVCVQLG